MDSMKNFLLFLLLQMLYLCVAEAGYNDSIRCEEFPEVANLTVEDIREETFRYIILLILLNCHAICIAISQVIDL